MSTNSGAGNDPAELMKHVELISLPNHDRQTDADGRFFCSGEFVTTKANANRSWRWKLLRSGESLYRLCVEPLSDPAITLSLVALYGSVSYGCGVLLTENTNIGQPSYQSADFSVASRLPRFDEVFTHGGWINLEISLSWTETKVSATPIPMSPASVLEGLYAKAMDGGETLYELVSSNGQSFSINGAIFEAKSAYFKRFFATDGWKEQTEGRMVLSWTSAVVKQLIRYVYLNDVDGDVCELLPDILDAAQMWELVGMKSMIEAQMKQRVEQAARDGDTDTAVEYLKTAQLHQLTSLVPLCNGILAANFDRFVDSGGCKQMIDSSEFCHLIKIHLSWSEEEMKASPIPLSPASVLKLQYNKVMNCADSAYKLVSSDGQSFYVSVTILEAKSAYFKRFFATEGWKEQTEGRMVLAWTSAVVRQLIHYVYLNDVDGDVCELLPDILDAAQMWELVGMKSMIEAQMKQRLEKATRDADTDTAAEYLQMTDLHQLTSLVPICNDILAANYDKFHDSDIWRQMEQNATHRHLVKGIVDHMRR